MGGVRHTPRSIRKCNRSQLSGVAVGRLSTSARPTTPSRPWASLSAVIRNMIDGGTFRAGVTVAIDSCEMRGRFGMATRLDDSSGPGRLTAATAARSVVDAGAGIDGASGGGVGAETVGSVR